jgi:hypothetical protein
MGIVAPGRRATGFCSDADESNVIVNAYYSPAKALVIKSALNEIYRKMVEAIVRCW